MELLRPDGRPVNDPAPLHEPLHFRKLREDLDTRFKALFNGYLQDLGQDDSTVKADHAALREHYGSKWRQLVQDTKLKVPTLDTDEALLYNSIDAHERMLRIQRMLKTPMQDLDEGLVPFDFELVGTIAWGDLWLAMNNHHWVAVAVNKETGVTTLWHGLGMPSEGLMQDLDELRREPICRQPSWTMAELRGIMTAMRWQRVSRPEPKVLHAVRKQRTSWFARRWN